MKEGKVNTYDGSEVKKIKERLAKEITIGSTSWQNNAVQYLLCVVDELIDENESLWFMLDEEKNSKTKPEHTKILNDLIQNRVAYLKMMQARKGEA